MAFHLFNSDLAQPASDPQIIAGSTSSAFITPRGLTNVGIQIPSSGNINLSNNLSVSGNINFINSNNRIERGNNQLSIFTSGTERLRVENDGNVLFFDAISETAQNAFNTSISGAVSVDLSLGTIILGGTTSSISSWNFINVPTGNSRAVTITAMISGNSSFTYGDACNVNGVAITNGIRWVNGNPPTSTSNTDIITFSIVRDSGGNTRVFGFATTNIS